MNMQQKRIKGKKIKKTFTFPFGSTNCIRFKGYYLSPLWTPLKRRKGIQKLELQNFLSAPLFLEPENYQSCPICFHAADDHNL